MSGSFRITNVNGISTTVDINTVGDSPTEPDVFSDAAMSDPVSLPVVITADTTFYVAGTGGFTLSVMVGGSELCGSEVFLSSAGPVTFTLDDNARNEDVDRLLPLTGGGGGQWGAEATAQFSFAGDPNGNVTADNEGDLCIDTSTPALYQATGAGTVWQVVGSSLVGGTFATDTVLGVAAAPGLTADDGDSITALGNNTVGAYTNSIEYETAVGAYALSQDSAGTENTAVGYSTAGQLTDGSLNTTVGANAGSNIIHGGNNTNVGANSGPGSDLNNTTTLGESVSASAAGGVAIGVDSGGNPATATDENDFVLGTSEHNVKIPGALTVTGDASVTETLTVNGVPITVGNATPIGNVVPPALGALYIDTSDPGFYFATGTVDTAWALLGGYSGVAAGVYSYSNDSGVGNAQLQDGIGAVVSVEAGAVTINDSVGTELMLNNGIGLFGATPVAQAAAITAPTGGAVVDNEARTAIAAILNAIGAAAGGIGITA